MGEIKSGNLKGASGRIGDLIYYNVNGKTYTRRAPVNGKAGTTLDKEVQRSRMRAVGMLYQAVKTTPLVDAWRMAATREHTKTGYHLFVKRNINVFSDDYCVGDFRLLSLSVGQLPVPFQWREKEGKANSCSMQWNSYYPTPGGKGTDRLHAAVIFDNEPYRVEWIGETGYKRSDGEAEIPLEHSSAREAHVYCFFVNEEGDSFSDGVYFHVNLLTND